MVLDNKRVIDDENETYTQSEDGEILGLVYNEPQVEKGCVSSGKFNMVYDYISNNSSFEDLDYSEDGDAGIVYREYTHIDDLYVAANVDYPDVNVNNGMCPLCNSHSLESVEDGIGCSVCGFIF